ncbi:cytochrome b [Streptomyces sp. NPDC050315]|uniref:cytochrome b n=1 Tax=Streptomyces sp. NPDC050315 TaxID=3155039 RepID=UPI00343F5221
MSGTEKFGVLARLLHWGMAVMVLAMLFIGAAMVASPTAYDALQDIHRPLGMLILVFTVVRFVNRLRHRPPQLPPTMHRWERAAAQGSEYLLYALMFALPLIGWGMLSAAGYPIVLYGPLRLPGLLPADPALYAALRQAHTVLAYLLFAAFLAHAGAVLFHTLVLRDRLLRRMAFGRAAVRRE